MGTSEIDEYWRHFLAATGLEAADYEVVAFGNSPAMADELAELVVRGPKRATAGLRRVLRTRRGPIARGRRVRRGGRRG